MRLYSTRRYFSTLHPHISNHDGTQTKCFSGSRSNRISWWWKKRVTNWVAQQHNSIRFKELDRICCFWIKNEMYILVGKQGQLLQYLPCALCELLINRILELIEYQQKQIKNNWPYIVQIWKLKFIFSGQDDLFKK